jgi:5-methylcytosine-specific restriction endonuclease McrA
MNPPKGKTMHEMRLMHYQRQDGLCWLCSEPLDLFLPVHSLGSSSWEHIIPRSSGGSGGWPNVALTHCECNRARGDRLLWKLERPRGRYVLKQRNAEKAQRVFEHRIVNRLRPIFERARTTEIR